MKYTLATGITATLERFEGRFAILKVGGNEVRTPAAGLKFLKIASLDFAGLSKLPNDFIFATGVTVNSPEGIYMTNNNVGKELRWVATTGYGGDWMIYTYWHPTPISYVTDYGEKVMNKENVKKLVNCDTDSLSLYNL